MLKLNTQQKLVIARTLGALVAVLRSLFTGSRSSNAVVQRKKINWNLDLREGIDLSIYLLGGFEISTFRTYSALIKEGDVVLDIGANIGAHTLPLAQLVGNQGKVIAFEPTQYAFNKPKRNIALNPRLEPRIIALQEMLVSSNTDQLPDAIYSSWPLENSKDLNSEHRGRLKSTAGARPITLDHYMKQAAVHRLNLIKLDVDGNEYDVLMGARDTIIKHKPTIILELSPCNYEDKFDHMLHLLWEWGYDILNFNNKKFPRDPKRIRRFVPPHGGVNALAICPTVN